MVERGGVMGSGVSAGRHSSTGGKASGRGRVAMTRGEHIHVRSTAAAATGILPSRGISTSMYVSLRRTVMSTRPRPQYDCRNGLLRILVKSHSLYRNPRP